MARIFIVEYTNEDCPGNQCLQMEIEAIAQFEDIYDILDQNYSHLNTDMIYAKENSYGGA